MTCEYIVPSKTIPHGKYQYIKTLEVRVVELENIVAAAGLPGPCREILGNVTHSNSIPDQSGFGTPSPKLKQHEDTKVMEATQYLKDLSLHAGGGFVGDESSNITVGQMFRFIAQTDSSTMGEDHPLLDPKSSADPSISISERISNPLADISHGLAEILLRGHLKHISTRWVILYRPHVIILHNKRATLVDPFDISTLNLVTQREGDFWRQQEKQGPSIRNDTIKLPCNILISYCKAMISSWLKRCYYMRCTVFELLVDLVPGQM